MLLLSRHIFKACISVYEGISPALLATISLGQNIKGANHQQLVNSLKTSNIVQSESILSTLRKLDRSHFTQQIQSYNNKPNKISKGQNMTDIFSHSIILNNIQPYLKVKDKVKVLDIGTGHGYLAFAIWMLAKELNKNPKKVLAIDCYEQCVEKCNEIKRNLKIQDASLEFKKSDVNHLFETNQKHDIIIGGFFVQPGLSSKLENLLEDNGIGIWPQASESGQGLFITRKNKPRQYLLETLFSQQVVQSSVQDYFISDHAQSSQNETQKSKQVSKEEQKIILERLRAQRNKQKNNLQQKLKQLIAKHQASKGIKTLTLKDMQLVPEISQVLQQLKRFK